ncbi:MAG: hypothetical protein PHY56_00300 [Candidatus Omnitrophica bacterium]|nr:hypothetical protein [Candidatus Omnitrophota bacterium]
MAITDIKRMTGDITSSLQSFFNWDLNRRQMNLQMKQTEADIKQKFGYNVQEEGITNIESGTPRVPVPGAPDQSTMTPLKVTKGMVTKRVPGTVEVDRIIKGTALYADLFKQGLAANGIDDKTIGKYAETEEGQAKLQQISQGVSQEALAGVQKLIPTFTMPDFKIGINVSQATKYGVDQKILNDLWAAVKGGDPGEQIAIGFSRIDNILENLKSNPEEYNRQLPYWNQTKKDVWTMAQQAWAEKKANSADNRFDWSNAWGVINSNKVANEQGTIIADLMKDFKNQTLWSIDPTDTGTAKKIYDALVPIISARPGMYKIVQEYVKTKFPSVLQGGTPETQDLTNQDSITNEIKKWQESRK